MMAMLVCARRRGRLRRAICLGKLPPIQIIGAGQLYPIAVSGLKDLGGDATHNVSRIFDATLTRDLKLSSFFRVIDSKSIYRRSANVRIRCRPVQFWRLAVDRRGISGEGRSDATSSESHCGALLFDVGEQRRMMGKRFTGQPNEVGEMARRFADAVLETMTGKRGPFDTKLAFVSTRGGHFKEVYTSWLDGGKLYRVTDNPTINLFPSFDKTSQHLLYLSYKTLSPELYLVDLGQGIEKRIAPPLGMAVGGTLTPEGQIVGAFAQEGRTNLYLLDQSGNEIRALTDNGAINVSPSVCSDGSRIAFTSDRSGNPQIYLMKMAGVGRSA